MRLISISAEYTVIMQQVFPKQGKISWRGSLVPIAGTTQAMLFIIVDDVTYNEIIAIPDTHVEIVLDNSEMDYVNNPAPAVASLNPSFPFSAV